MNQLLFPKNKFYSLKMLGIKKYLYNGWIRLGLTFIDLQENSYTGFVVATVTKEEIEITRYLKKNKNKFVTIQLMPPIWKQADTEDMKDSHYKACFGLLDNKAINNDALLFIYKRHFAWLNEIKLKERHAN